MLIQLNEVYRTEGRYQQWSTRPVVFDADDVESVKHFFSGIVDLIWMDVSVIRTKSGDEFYVAGTVLNVHNHIKIGDK